MLSWVDVLRQGLPIVAFLCCLRGMDGATGFTRAPVGLRAGVIGEAWKRRDCIDVNCRIGAGRCSTGAGRKGRSSSIMAATKGWSIPPESFNVSLKVDVGKHLDMIVQSA